MIFKQAVGNYIYITAQTMAEMNSAINLEMDNGGVELCTRFKQGADYHATLRIISRASNYYVIETEKEVIKEIEIPAQPKLQDKTIISNGNYTADSGYDGIGTARVNVPEVIREVPVEVPVEVPASPILQDKTITENGEYNADEGYDGLGTITANIIPDLPDEFNEETWQQFLRWKQVHFTEYNGPESSELEPEDIYNGCKITVEVLKDNTIVELNATAGTIEWGDGSYQTITEESKDLDSSESY